MMNIDNFLEMLWAFVEKAGSQKKAAENLEISTAYLTDLLLGLIIGLALGYLRGELWLT